MEILSSLYCCELLLIILAHFEVEVAPPRWPSTNDIAEINELHWMQTLSQSYSIVAVGTSLYGTLVVNHELVVDPNLLHA